ncbi:MAG: hypothetical protein ACOC2W_03215 [bacterium]
MPEKLIVDLPKFLDTSLNKKCIFSTIFITFLSSSSGTLFSLAY